MISKIRLEALPSHNSGTEYALLSFILLNTTLGKSLKFEPTRVLLPFFRLLAFLYYP